MILNNKPDPMEIWANQNLNADELASYKKANLDNANLWNSYITNNQVKIEIVYKDVFLQNLDETCSIPIGTRAIIAGDAFVESHPTWQSWVDRFVRETGIMHPII